ncbi:MAG: peptidoglycan-binding protein [Acidimicrobiia bacterium]
MRISPRLLVFHLAALFAVSFAVAPASAAGSDLVVEGWTDAGSWVESVSLGDLVSGVPELSTAGALTAVAAGTCSESGTMSELVFTGDAGEVTVAATVLEDAFGWPSANLLMAGFGSPERPGCWSDEEPITETRRLRIGEISVGDDVGGDGDGFVECAETVVFGITVSSVTETLSNAQVVVEILGTEGSLVGASSSRLPDLGPGDEGAALFGFTVEIDDVVTGHGWVTIAIVVGSADEVYESHRHVPVGCGLAGSPVASPQIVFPVAGTNHYVREWLTTHNPSIHEGVDVFASRMIPIVAVADGVIADVNWEYDPYHDGPGDCCAVSLIHDSGWESWYLHLNNDTPGTDDGAGWGLMPGIVRGTRVSAGQVIGLMGDSTNAEDTAPHIHFELHDPAGNPVDPYDYLISAANVAPTCVGATDDECFPFVVLSWNSRDQRVWTLQTLLGQAGFSPGTVDGVFGSLTDASVRDFQGAAAIEVDGLVDEETWNELNRVVDDGIDLRPEVIARLGDRGLIVIEIQGLLAQAGFSPGSIDGIFGSLTESAVRSFQSSEGLSVDGLVDEDTFGALDQSTSPTAIVRFGDRGLVVIEVQSLLTDAGFSLGRVDGVFGSLTESAVRAFQSAEGLSVDGVVGPQTFAALSGEVQRVIITRFGDTGPAVVEVQSLLATGGFSPGPVDGIFGSLTQSAVRALQTARGLPVDGIVDQATLNALS